MELTLNSELLSSISDFISNGYLLLFILSLLPITELRLSVPFGILILGLSWKLVFIVCVLSNSIIGIFLLYSLGWGISLCSNIPILKRLIDRLLILSQKKYERYERYKSHALTLFVAIPFPGTGAWTGSLVSYAIGLNKKKSAFCIIKGVVISGIIMTFLSVSGKVIIG